MDRVTVTIDPSVGVSPADFVAAWGQDADAMATGTARVEKARGEVFVPGLVELVVVPLAVNLVSSALYDLVRHIVMKARRGKEVSEVEVVELATAEGERLVVVRCRRELP